MSFSDNLKGKNLVVVAAAAALLVIVLVVVFFSGSKKGSEGPEVITKRVKINLQDESQPTADQTKPAETAKPAVQVETPAGVVTTTGKTATEPIKVDVAAEKAPEVKTPEKKEPPKKEVSKKEPEKKEPEKVVAEKKPVATAKAKEAPPVKAPASATAKAAKPKKAVVAKAASNGAWGLNVASFTNNLDAGNLKSRLKAAGYKSYVTEFTKDSVKWYRVRVGFYRTKAEALSVGRKIQQKFRVQTPWVFKPARDEVSNAG